MKYVFFSLAVLLICCGIYAINCYGETQKLSEGNSIKQQEEIVPGQTQNE